MNPLEKQNQGEFWGKTPKFWGFLLLKPSKFGFFSPRIGNFFGGKWEFQAQVSTGENPGESGGNLGFIYKFMAEDGPKKGQNSPKIQPRANSREFGGFGGFLGWNWGFWGWVLWIWGGLNFWREFLGLNWVDLGSDFGVFWDQIWGFLVRFDFFGMDLDDGRGFLVVPTKFAFLGSDLRFLLDILGLDLPPV